MAKNIVVFYQSLGGGSKEIYFFSSLKILTDPIIRIFDLFSIIQLITNSVQLLF